MGGRVNKLNSQEEIRKGRKPLGKKEYINIELGKGFIPAKITTVEKSGR